MFIIKYSYAFGVWVHLFFIGFISSKKAFNYPTDYGSAGPLLIFFMSYFWKEHIVFCNLPSKIGKQINFTRICRVVLLLHFNLWKGIYLQDLIDSMPVFSMMLFDVELKFSFLFHLKTRLVFKIIFFNIKIYPFWTFSRHSYTLTV